MSRNTPRHFSIGNISRAASDDSLYLNTTLKYFGVLTRLRSIRLGSDALLMLHIEWSSLTAEQPVMALFQSVARPLPNYSTLKRWRRWGLGCLTSTH